MDDRSASALKAYRDKRNFDITPEPADGGVANETERVFVIQKHWATRLHYDFRLELDGTMKSWAVPKGPSFDTAEKRMAVHVEDHPLSYNKFEGTIPPKQYGAGKVIIWDKGTWIPMGDPHKGYSEGKLKFELRGHKLHGHWTLVRMKQRPGERPEAWLLIKEKDEHARSASEYFLVRRFPSPPVKCICMWGYRCISATGMIMRSPAAFRAMRPGNSHIDELSSDPPSTTKPA